MADYDVAAIALASPPSSTPPATYTPAISVRNNGQHDAIAYGWLTFYRKSTGVMVAQFNVTSGTIHPGATGNATADGTLDLSAEPVGAQFIVTGYVTSANDQVESNNPLAPVIITISAEPPPPPPPVEAHASQHEEGGSDVLSVDGLTGKLADAQTAEAHAASHEPGGEDEITGLAPGPHAATHSPEGGDEIDVTGLPGLLADPQTAAAHKGTHESSGPDEINVNGLQGVLAAPQTPVQHANRHEPGGDDEITETTPAVHDNDRHLTEYIDAYGATSIANGIVDGHNGDVTAHSVSNVLELVSRKGAASGYAPLDAGALVPADKLGTGTPTGAKFLRDDRSWQSPAAAQLADGPAIVPKPYPSQGSATTAMRSDFNSNAAGGLIVVAGDPTLLQTQSHVFSPYKYVVIPATADTSFTLHIRSAGFVVGNSALHIYSTARVSYQGGSLHFGEVDQSLPVNVDGMILTLDSWVSIEWNQGAGAFDVGYSTVVRLPAVGAVYEELVFSERAESVFTPDQQIQVRITLECLDGTGSDGIRATQGDIIVFPGSP